MNLVHEEENSRKHFEHYHRLATQRDQIHQAIMELRDTGTPAAKSVLRERLIELQDELDRICETMIVREVEVEQER